MKQIKPLTTSSLQTLQVAGTVGHWILLSTIDYANHEVKYYDSLYNSINEDTLTVYVIAALHVKGKHICSHISMHMMHMAKQYGDTEYGLYAIATIVCLAFGDDPCNHSSFTNQYAKVSPWGVLHKAFPVINKRRATQKVINKQQCEIYFGICM